MKLFRLLPCILLSVFAFTACSDDDDDKEKYDIRSFPTDGITLSLGMDKLKLYEYGLGGIEYSHGFSYEYDLGYYLDENKYKPGSEGKFQVELLNEEYKDYFPDVSLLTSGFRDKTTPEGGRIYNILDVYILLKYAYRHDVEEIQEMISKNPVKLKITWVPK